MSCAIETISTGILFCNAVVVTFASHVKGPLGGKKRMLLPKGLRMVSVERRLALNYAFM